jgi:hypothetical protein
MRQIASDGPDGRTGGLQVPDHLPLLHAEEPGVEEF